MTEVSKEAVEALAEILMSSFPEVSFVGLDMSVDFINRLSKSGFTIAPIAPVTDEKLRELSVLAHDILDGEGYDEAALEVKSALSELAQLRADDGDKRMLFAKAIDYGQADAVVFVPHNGDVVMLEVTAKLPTPPKED